MPDALRMDALAKVNLRLRILDRLESGYHTLETVFCAVSLADTLCVLPSTPGIGLSLEGDIDVGPIDRNLAVRAAASFYRALGQSPAIRIELTKRIPAAGGLGGGSSDAAATLLALNELHRRPFSRPRLLEIAAELGSDVPFFLCGSPLALAWGRGERLLPLTPLPPKPMTIVHPGVGMGTHEAFSHLSNMRGGGCPQTPFAFDADALSGWDAIARAASNDFEAVAAARIPRFHSIRNTLMEHGAEIAMLAGSGACIFGIFPATGPRDTAAQRLRDEGLTVWTAETIGA